MDLTPFQFINPCGYHQLKIVQLKDFIDTSFQKASRVFLEHIIAGLDYKRVEYEQRDGQ